MAYGGPAAIAPRHERRTGFDFWRALGRRCGQQEHWPWETVEGALDAMFAPAGVCWSDVCATGLYAPEQTYEKYLEDGFATASGKVELASSLLEELGHDPLPAFTPVAVNDEAYPLTLITGARRQPYYSSQHRQVQRLRKRHPDPVVEMAAETAARLGLAQGDWVWIETCQGRIRQRLALADMRPDTVSVDYGWWFPENGTNAPDLGGFWSSNANVLTTADTALCDPILGQWSTRSLRCKVYKADEVELPIEIKYARSQDRTALIDLLWENGMEHAEPIEDYLLAVCDNAVVGCVRLEDFPDLAMIRPVAVSPDHRKKGIGRLLIQHIMPAHKPTAVVGRGDAVPFYKALGFEKISWEKIPAT